MGSSAPDSYVRVLLNYIHSTVVLIVLATSSSYQYMVDGYIIMEMVVVCFNFLIASLHIL